MASSKSVVAPSAATDVFFNARFPQYEIPVGDFSNRTSRASSIQSAINSALSSGLSHVYIPASYWNYASSAVSFTPAVQFIREGVVEYDPVAYGAIPDGIEHDDAGSITSGQATLTVTGAAFTSADVGKRIVVEGAGANDRRLITTIAGVTSSTVVTLAANASTTVSDARVVYGTDSTAAFTGLFQSLVGCHGARIRIPPAHGTGFYLVGDLPWVSMTGNANAVDATGADSDFLTGAVLGNIYIDATGAVIEHVGTGSLFRFWGSTSQRRVVWSEGEVRGSTTDTEALFKCRDGNRFSLKPRRVGSAIRHFLMQNWLNWTENAEIGGEPLDISGADVSIECQNGNQASRHDTGTTGSDGNAGEASFARLRVTDIQNGARIYTLWARGNVYDGFMEKWTGNANTLQAHFRQRGTCTGTTLRGIHHEQGDSKNAWAASIAYDSGNDVSGNVTNYSPTWLKIHSQDDSSDLDLDVRMHFECTTAGTSGATEPDWNDAPAVGDTITDGTVVWTNRGFSAGYVVDAEGTSASATQLVKASDLIWSGAFTLTRGLAAVNSNVQQFHATRTGGEFTYAFSTTINNNSTGTILSSSSIAADDVLLVNVKNTNNSAFGACIVVRNSSTTGISINTLGTANNGAFFNTAGDLTWTSTSGNNNATRVRILRLGPGNSE